eukprot:6381896-Alexandrium_andersonii.AAC.1
MVCGAVCGGLWWVVACGGLAPAPRARRPTTIDNLRPALALHEGTTLGCWSAGALERRSGQPLERRSAQPLGMTLERRSAQPLGNGQDVKTV